MIDISGLPKEEVLAALYNASSLMGMGFLQAGCNLNMTPDEANKYLEEGDDTNRMFGKDSGKRLYFDYLRGRPMKVDITGDSFDERLFDRDAGPGQAQKAISALKAKLATDSTASFS